LVLQQVQAGRLSLDDRLSTWYPQIPKSRRITVAMLLNMSSGIADFVNGNFGWLTKAQRKDPKRIWKPDRMIAGAARMPREFAVPGSQFAYSNTNTIILGRILEKATGISYEEVLQRGILDPLRMDRSFIDLSGDLWPPHAQTYSNLYGEIHGSPKTLRVTDWSLSTGWSAGGLASTLWDMKKWAQALGTGEGVLNRSMQRQRIKDCVVQATGAEYTQEYCLGVAIYREVSTGDVVARWHNGTMLGATSYVAYFPRTGARLVVQANQDAQTGEQGLTIPDKFFLRVFQDVPELLGL
jgi:D-alanyl-D-alanine carboxypeptidase